MALAAQGLREDEDGRLSPWEEPQRGPGRRRAWRVLAQALGAAVLVTGLILALTPR